MWCFALLVCLLWLAAAPVSSAELTGTVHAAGRPTQHAVVWLAAPDAPVVGGIPSGVDPMGSAVFGAANPYNGRVRLLEIYAERYFGPRGALLGVRAGRFRMPFGINNRSDHGYSGFLRPPLIRYDGYCGISNNWLEDR